MVEGKSEMVDVLWDSVPVGVGLGDRYELCAKFLDWWAGEGVGLFVRCAFSGESEEACDD